MDNLFILTWLLSSLAGVIGLIKPQWIKLTSRKIVLVVCGGIALISLIGVGVTAPPIKVKPTIITDTTAQSIDLRAPTDVKPQQEKYTTTSTPTVAVAQNNSPQRDVSVQPHVASTAASTTVIQPQTNTNSAPVQQPSSEPAVTLYAVVAVIDGDTLKIIMNGKSETLRLIGMDTPETVDPRKPVQCFGKEASNKAKELLAGKKISIEADPTQGERDKYSRLLVYVRRSDGLFYNQYMIEQGFAHEYTYNLPYKYQAEFKAAQKEAKTAQRGLWSLTTCNGDTTQAAVAPAPTTTTQPSSTTTNEQPASQPQSGARYYTSSYYTAHYYYPEACDGWKTLSTKYLKAFDSLKALLAAYPDRTLSPQCN